MISISPIENFNKKFDVVSLFVICDGKILLLKRQEGKPQGNTWGPPAGKADRGEDLGQAISRETFEETGILIEVTQISKHKNRYYVRHGDLDFVFHVYAVELDNKPGVSLRSAEHSEFSWFTPKKALAMDLVQDEEIPINDFFFGNKE